MGLATYSYNRSTSGGEIIRELVNASDGQGLHFNGSSGNIDIASPPDLGTKLSLELIIQADAWGSAAYLIDFGNGGRFLFGSHAGISLNLGIYDNASWNSFGVKVLDDFKVHHLVVAVDGTAAILYDNGSQVGTATISASHGIDSCSDAKIAANYVAGDWFNGTLYRTRFWNKTLSQAEVTASYENATVPFSDQYSSTASPLIAGTLTSGKLYRINAYVSGDDFTNLGGTNVTGNEFVTTGTTPTTWSNGSSLIQIGCTADFDLAFSNPTQSLMVQDRANIADGTSSATGVVQVTPIEQLNSKSARVGTSAATPADGDLVVSGNAGIGPVSPSFTPSWLAGDKKLLVSGPTGGAVFVERVNGTARRWGMGVSSGGSFIVSDDTGGTAPLTIDSAGVTSIPAKAVVGYTSVQGPFGTDGWAPALQQLGSQGVVSVRSLNDVWGGAMHLAKSRGSSGTPTAAADDDRAGAVYFEAHDGTDFQNYVGAVECYLDGAVASNDTPGRLVFSTAADGANTLTERMRIDSAGLTTVKNPGWPLKNEISNSGFDVWSNSTLESVATIEEDDCASDDTGDWTKVDCTLAFDTDHYEITPSGSTVWWYLTSVSLTAGKLYEISVDVKNGVGSTSTLQLFCGDGAHQFSPTISTTGSFVTHTFCLEVATTTGSGEVGLYDATYFSSDIEMKNFSFKEVTPGCVAADSKAFDGWDKNGNSEYGDIWRQHNDATLTHDGSFYSLKMTSHATSTMQVYQKPSYPFTDSINLQKYAGRTVTMGAWVYVSDSSTPSVFINDTTNPWTGLDSSDIHSGATGWEWLEVTKTISASPGLFVIGFNQIANKTCYVSQPMLVFGSAIGAGNYSRPSGEWINLESNVTMNNFSVSNYSTGTGVMNVEAESNGKLPKGCQTIRATTLQNDSVSSGAVAFAAYGYQASPAWTGDIYKRWGSTVSTTGNSVLVYGNGTTRCNVDGDVGYNFGATGVNTLQVWFIPTAVQLR